MNKLGMKGNWNYLQSYKLVFPLSHFKENCLPERVSYCDAEVGGGTQYVIAYSHFIFIMFRRSKQTIFFQDYITTIILFKIVPPKKMKMKCYLD